LGHKHIGFLQVLQHLKECYDIELRQVVMITQFRKRSIVDRSQTEPSLTQLDGLFRKVDAICIESALLSVVYENTFPASDIEELSHARQ